jgi:hypothetical protein
MNGTSYPIKNRDPTAEHERMKAEVGRMNQKAENASVRGLIHPSSF